MPTSTAVSLAAPQPLQHLPAFLLRPIQSRKSRTIEAYLPDPVSIPTPTPSPAGPSMGEEEEAGDASSSSIAPWFAIRTQLNRELAVTTALDALSEIRETYCPRYLATWVSRGRSYERLVPYLATYVFARWAARDFVTWHAINDERFVVHVLGGATPSPVRDAEIDRLRRLIGDGRTVPLPPTTWVPDVGSAVLVTEGAFVGYDGVVHAVEPPFMRVKISGLFSRETVLSLPISWCEPADDIEPNATPGRSGKAQKRKRGRRGGSFRKSSKYPFVVA